MKKSLIAIAAFLLLSAMASAEVVVTDVNVSVNDNGSGFIGVSDVNINFSVRDNNASCVMAGTTFDADITYSTTKGARTTAIVTDLNLGDVNKSSGACTKKIAAECSITPVRCSYVWTTSAMNSITDANYYIDVNVAAWSGIDVNILYDFNMDTNNSFYIDNTMPSCAFEEKAGNAYAWNVSGEGAAVAVGSKTTLSYKTDEESYSTATLDASQVQELFLSSGKHDYYCYATDSTGNVGSVTEKLDFRQSEGVSVAISGSGATAQPVAGIAASLPATIAGFPTPIVLLVGLVAIVLLAGGKKSRKGRRKRR